MYFLTGIDEPIMMIDVTGGVETRYYYHFDGLGSVVALSDVNSVIVERYSYDVFGEPNRTSDVNNPYMFTGRAYDSEVGLYYYRARHYSPYLGRFLQTDPVGYSAGLNLYTYCGNNPINRIDPFGLDWWEDAAMFYLWATGEGPDTLYFGPGSNQVQDMMNAPGVEQARRDFAQRRESAAKDSREIPSEHHGGTDFGLRGLYNAGLNPTRQFVGSYYIDMYANPDGTMRVVLRNKTSMTSFLYGVGPNWERSKFSPFGNMWQEYEWTEEIPQ